MKKSKILLIAAVSISTMCFGAAQAADVTTWSGLNTTDNILIKNDITAGGTPKVISLSATVEQTVNGGGYSLIGAEGYSFALNGTGNYIFENLGHYTAGTAADNTFSYTALNGETKYVSIDASVNSFPAYFITRYGTGTAVNVNNSVFTNNGGRIIVLSGSSNTLNLSNSVFYNNSSDKNVAIISGSGILNIENSIFYNNSNTRNDGGVLDISNSSSVVTIKDSYFVNNSGQFGGVINQIAGTLKIEGSKFEGNTSNKDGGAICLDGNIGEVTYIKDSEFINNRNGGSYYDGGAISTTGGYIRTIDNVIFDGNVAISGGGGLWGGMNSKHKAKDPVLITGTIFRNNEAGTGGGYFSEGSSRQNYTYITDSEFTDNTVKATGHYLSFNIPVGGGMISTGGVPMVINNTVFSGNVALPDGSNSYSAGGGLYFAGSSSASYPVKIVDSTFSNNSALEGGAIYIENADAAIIAATKDVVFSGNTAGADADDYNAGSDIYFDTNDYSATLSLNAASGKKIVFNGGVAAYQGGNITTMDINKSGVTYNTYDGTTETSVTAGTAGEIQFNDRVGDETQYFTSINLYGGKLSIGQNAANNALITNPDGYLNDNNFYVKGDSILSTVNGIIGNFAPKVFNIENGVSLDYMFDVDLVNAKSDTLGITANEGTLQLSSFNVISDSDAEGLKIKYSDTNVGGVVKDGYTITTSVNTYDVTAENDSTGSYVVFTQTGGGGGLPSAIAAGADQYIITDGQDENVTAWTSATGNIINNDMDINGNGNSIYTENGIDGIVVSAGNNVTFRDIKTLSGFNNAITNNGGNISIVDSSITGNSGAADITNNSGTVAINAATSTVTIGSTATSDALLSDGGTINLNGSNKIVFNGAVSGSNSALMNILADTTFNGDVSGMDIVHSSGNVDLKNFSGSDYTMNNGVLNLQESGSFAPNTFELNNGTVNIADESGFSPLANTLNGGNINAANDAVGNLNLNSLTLSNIINLAVDVDLNNQLMDEITASSVSGSGMINVNQFNVLSDTDKPEISIQFADAGIKDYITTDVKTIESKIFKYSVNYDSETGKFIMAGGGGNSKGYSSSVMASPVAAQLQGYFTQLNSYDEAFRNMDMYMLLPSRTRRALKNRNRVAINSPFVVYDKAKNVHEDKTAWVRTRTAFEKVPLKNGPKVNNISYGTYMGGESDMYDLGKGWEGRYGVYVGYNGSHQSYNGISMYQNGGTLGLVGMAYKGDFFQGLTINAGANGGEAYTKFGNENFSMLMAGIASKTGYNIEFKEGKYIVQPSLLLSYSFVNSFDYVNSAGVNISSDPLHAIQVEPNIKFIANLKNSWQPYATVGMVWNIMDSTHYMANSVSLPELSVKPYVKYGIGIRKAVGERFTGFFQTYLTNGGRNGVGLQLGLRWALGGRKSKNDKL